MSLRVVGAGLGRTGTTSLKAALEQLLGGPCYHMLEVRERPADPDVWATPTRSTARLEGILRRLRRDRGLALRAVLVGDRRCVPDALIRLSVRDVEAWW